MADRLILCHSDRGGTVDGIRDYTHRLAAELSCADVEVEMVPGVQRPDRATWTETFQRARRSGASSALVVQYMPFCFAKWGFAPWLPLQMLRIRMSRPRPVLAIMVHEPYVPMISCRWALMGMWQRVQLAAIRATSDVVFTSIEPWARRLRRQRPRRPVHHLPVGSNFPDRRATRSESRNRMGVGHDTIVVATIGRDHPSWRGQHVVAALNAIAAARPEVLWLSLGAEAPPLDGLAPTISVRSPGYLDDAELAGALAGADLFLAPLLDGVSTRRGTLMAALQHELPVVGTLGPLTDSILSDSNALRLSPVRDRDLFARNAAELAGDPAAREALAVEARLLFERHFDWPVIARRMLAELPSR